MTVSLDALLKILEKGGTTALVCGLVYVIYALMIGKLVPGYLYQQLKVDYDRMTQIAFRGTELGERVVNVMTPANDKETQL